MNIRTALAAGLAVLLPVAAQAAPIFYTATDLSDSAPGEDLWQYEYFVANETSLLLDSIEIRFDLDDYEFNLVPGGFFGDEVDPADYEIASGWDGVVLPDDPFFGADGSLLLYRDSPIPEVLAADAVGGFFVTFIWEGNGTPGSQPFDYFTDPFGPAAGSGFTQPLPSVSTVAEPGAGILFAIGMIALIGVRARGDAGLFRSMPGGSRAR